MGTRLRYHLTAERPTAKLWLYDDDGSLINFSSGYTFSFKIAASPADTALLTKVSGINGAAGSGSEPDGTPNVVITWTAGELNLSAGKGSYVWQLTATTSSLDRVFEGSFESLGAIA